MKILAIESSCDETAAAVVEDGRKILSNIVDSQVETHALYGGVVPEIASRRHMEAVVRVTDCALQTAGMQADEVDAVAATCALVASGGHSLIVLVRGYTEFEILGGTRDDAAGEAFDKVARVLGLGYPGGPKIDKMAAGGDPDAYKLPVSHVKDAPMDFSFSGLKTAVINLAHNAEQKGEAIDKAGLAASFCRAVVDTLVPRLAHAVDTTGVRDVVCAGGVAANSWLRRALGQMVQQKNARLYLPPLALCGDNAAMIGAQAYYEFLAGHLGTRAQNAFATAEITEEICRKIR